MRTQTVIPTSFKRHYYKTCLVAENYSYIYCYLGDDAEVYPIKTIIKNLQTNEDERWSTFFKEGVEALEFNDLEKALSERPYKVQPNTRFDYTFRCPSGRQVRFKVCKTHGNQSSATNKSM